MNGVRQTVRIKWAVVRWSVSKQDWFVCHKITLKICCNVSSVIMQRKGITTIPQLDYR